MSTQDDITQATTRLNEAATKANTTTDFFDNVLTGSETQYFTNPNNGKSSPSVKKATYDRTDELFSAAESDINQAVTDAQSSAGEAQVYAANAQYVEERVLGVGVSIYRGTGVSAQGNYVQNGDVVPVDTTHLAVVINGKVEDVAMSPVASGAVSLLTEYSATIGGTPVMFVLPFVRIVGNVNDIKNGIFANGQRIKTNYHTVNPYGSAEYLVVPVGDYSIYSTLSVPDDTYGDFYTNSGLSVAVLQTPNGIANINKLGCIPDGDYDAGTGTDNSAALLNLSLFCESRGGMKFQAFGEYRGKHKINRNNYWFEGNATIWYDGADSQDITFETEAYYGAKNFGPFLGAPWDYPEDLAPNVTLHRLTASATDGDYSISVDTTSGLQKGMTGVLIQGVHEQSTASNLIPQRFQFMRIADIQPNTVIFDERIYNDLDATGLDAYFIQWKMIENIRVVGITYKNKVGANYLHRIGGCWDAHIDVKMYSETACGAAACNRQLYYGVSSAQGYNGISTARMSEDITVNADIAVWRDPLIGAVEELGCFIEENPRSINIEKLTLRHAKLVMSMLTEHSNIYGDVDIDNEDIPAILFGSAANLSNVRLRGRAVSDSTVATVQSEYTSTQAKISFDGDIINTGSGLAWSHNSGTSNSQPVFKGTANAGFSSVNYIDVIRADLDQYTPQSKYIYTPDGIGKAIVSGGAISSSVVKGVITGITWLSTGKLRVQLDEAYSGAFTIFAYTSQGDTKTPVNYSDGFEVWCYDQAGVLADPTFISAEVFLD